MPLETAPYPGGGKTSGFFFGARFGHPEGLWLSDPWGKRLEGAPISEKAKRELLNMREADRKPFYSAFQPAEGARRRGISSPGQHHARAASDRNVRLES